MKSTLKFIGIATPPEKYEAIPLDLNHLIIKNIPATFILKFDDKTNTEELKKDDIIVVDRSLSPQQGNLVIIETDGTLAIEHYQPKLNSIIWGVVTYAIHNCID